MRNILFSVTIILGLNVGVTLADEPIRTDARQIRYIKGEVLVQPRAGLPKAEFDKLIRQFGGKRIGEIKRINVHIVEVPANAEFEVVKALSKNKQISFAEVNQLLQPTLTLNDPNLSSAWQITKIGADSAWDYAGGQGVLLADCDTGVDSDHPDLVGNLDAASGWNTVSNDTSWEDINGHGTSTSGVMAAVGNNTQGAAGVAYKARIIPVRVSNSSDGSASISALASCVTYAADKGARGANLSYSGVCGSSTVFNAAAYLRNKTGGVVVAAAANTGTELAYSNDSNITCVSATDSSDKLATFSSYGNYVDVAAPGVSTYLTKMGGGYGTASGTSFSSPITLGVYALMMQANPLLTSSQLDDILFSTAVDLGSLGWDKYYGYGRIDAASAVQKARLASVSDTIKPTVAISSPANSSQVSGVVPVEVSATDNVGVSNVTLSVGGQKLADDNSAPYQFSVDTNVLPDGPLTLQAQAIDEAGNAAASAITVNVKNDTTPPSVSFTSPQNGTTVGGVVTVSVNATDNKNLSKITLLIDGRSVQNVYTSASTGSLNYSWTVCPNLKLCSGTSTLTATAYDASNNSSSASVTVTKSSTVSGGKKK